MKKKSDIKHLHGCFWNCFEKQFLIIINSAFNWSKIQCNIMKYYYNLYQFRNFWYSFMNRKHLIINSILIFNIFVILYIYLLSLLINSVHPCSIEVKKKNRTLANTRLWNDILLMIEFSCGAFINMV